MKKLMGLIIIVMFVSIGCSSNINNIHTNNEDYRNSINNTNPRTNIVEIEGKTIERKGLSLSSALVGDWLTDKEDVLTFDGLYLKQGGNLFSYVVVEESKNQLHISVFGLEGFLIKDKKLFDTYIVFDETRCNIHMRKVVVQLFDSNLVFQSNAIFIDAIEEANSSK